ncbi:MAG: hypothetical protein EBR02_07620 [Alphaproteobacteria bacterium]|nr:hypothetical protein [Alphaproteobacteria bacterium]
MAEGKKSHWGAIIAGAAIVTGIVAACVFTFPGLANAAGNFVGSIVQQIGSLIGDVGKAGPVGATAVLGTAAIVGGWAGKRAAEIGASAQDLSNNIRGV